MTVMPRAKEPTILTNGRLIKGLCLVLSFYSRITKGAEYSLSGSDIEITGLYDAVRSKKDTEK